MMNCLPCFNNDDDEEAADPPPPTKGTPTNVDAAKEAAASSSNAKTFTFRELAMATKNFRQECLLGEGGFGRVFKGKLHSTGQVVAVKQLDRNGMQGNKEFLVEVLMLSLIQHTNLVSLIGYCADGDQRLLVYEYLPMGSLENQLFGDDPEKKPMDWFTRMKIASGAANGLEYLHDKANPPVIYRDLKPSNILLDENYEPKLSDFGLAKLGAGGGKINPTSRVMGTYGYSAPEYSSGGELTLKSDIYSFGVVLLELITGRKAIDTTRPNNEQNLVTWAQPIFREPKRFPDLADPKLNSAFPVTSLNQAVGICAMCLQEEPAVRPLISDVVAALSFLAIPQPITTPASDSTSTHSHSPPSEQKMQYETEINLSEEAPQSEPGSSHYDERSSESSEIEDESASVSDLPNEGSSENYSVGEKSGSSRYSEREVERQDSDRRHSSDISEEHIIYTSESDSGGEDTSYDDAETRELDDPERLTDSTANDSLYSATDSSLKSDSGNKSSKNGSSRRSSPTKSTGSRRRKPVVTFKEPSLSGKKHGTIKPKEETSSSDNNSNSIYKANNENNDNDNNQTVLLPAATNASQQQSSSSSSSESSSDSEDEKKSLKQVEKKPPRQVEKITPTQDDISPPRKDERSPQRKHKRSPPRKDEISPPRKDEKSPQRKDERSPPRKDERSPPRKDDKSPPRKDDKSPTKSPPRKDERSPPRQDERSSPRHEENTQKSRSKAASQGEDIPSVDKIEANHRVFEQTAKKDGPKLRHLRTR